ncbi:hypothetical protein KUTeg_007303 [Tegillarca granosa]|uniref:tryptophan--tRNA ligase n=1 Tax=Tegillarca granosa TaxID=220873 RepID=A0ABQ9FCV1_TEGGR|nr:hypothetical protein KUTeg_007303 [Tegillarca granosa]
MNERKKDGAAHAQVFQEILDKNLPQNGKASQQHQVPQSPNEDRVFSGIQPTGVPHIGNYLGAIQNWVKLQDQYKDIIYCVVDLHSITVPQDPKVPQHAELGWILMCLCTMSRLKLLPQWKEKSKTSQHVGVGLFNYPVLQAADILLYKSAVVPVGDDQVKHLELARDLARLFNNKYGEIFPEPQHMLGSSHRIKSLRDPAVKMSKSDLSKLGHVDITDTPENIREKFKKSKSDFTSNITYDPVERPAISNLVDIYAGITGLSTEQVCEDCKNHDTLNFKLALADIVIETFKPVREEVNRLLEDKGHIDKVLYKGYEKASEIAEQTLQETKKAIGVS